MARRIRDKNLESRAARHKLKPSGKPYYRAIGEGLHLGYRKGKTEGKWVVRRYAGNQAYITDTIGTADDTADADGTIVLNFWQAQEKAREIGGKLAYAGPYRVRDGVAAYLAHLDGQGKQTYGTRIRFERHILPVLGDMAIDELDADQIRAWHYGLARSGPMIPNKKTGDRHRQIDFGDPEQVRKRQVSANRCMTILKSALNYAFKNGGAKSDAEWRKVDKFKDVERSRDRYLTLGECQRLLNACAPDFRVLVRGALETGARYGNLRRLRCGDYNPDSGTVRMRFTKSGKEYHIVLTEEGAEFFAALVAGQPNDAPMFGKHWSASQQVRRMKVACKRASIVPHVGFHQLRHTWASLSVMNGMPLHVVANNLGHKDTKMVEKHYGHLAPSYVVDQVRKHAPRFGKVSSNVRSLA